MYEIELCTKRKFDLFSIRLMFKYQEKKYDSVSILQT